MVFHSKLERAIRAERRPVALREQTGAPSKVKILTLLLAVVACPGCGERLISKTSAGLSCCGCGRPLPARRFGARSSLSPKTLVVFSALALVLLPFVGAIAVTDALRSDGDWLDVQELRESD